LAIQGTAKSTLGLVNYPIVFGGQTVFPGDLIVGDDDGLVIVRREDVQDVLENKQRIEKRSRKKH
jgi:4-hydroxy-4-methyl-2-oxoglutarate aldolase